MSWTRLDDGWTDQRSIAELPLGARWHYLCMIQYCSRTQRFDGFIQTVAAERCSDIDHPQTALSALAAVGLIVRVQGGYVLLKMEEDHAPPQWIRNRSEGNKQAQRRKRAHKAGDHSLCLKANCELAPRPTDGSRPAPKLQSADSHADKVADDRTGQAQDKELSPIPEIEASNPWGRGSDAWTPEKDEAWLRGGSAG